MDNDLNQQKLEAEIKNLQAQAAKTDAERKGISRHGPRLDLGGGESERPGC